MPRQKQFIITPFTKPDFMDQLNKHLNRPVPCGTKNKPKPKKKKKKPIILYDTLHTTMVSDMTCDQLLIAMQPDAKSRAEARRWIKLTKKPLAKNT